MIDNRTPEQKREDYRDKRWAWAEAIGRPYRQTWKAKAVKPPPGEIDADAVEEG